MAFSEICRICLSVNVRMYVLKKTGLQHFYKALTNRFVSLEMDEDEEPIIVCFICHARLIRCRRLQQQAIESNSVLEQLLAGGSMSIPKPHEARDEIQFTPINHLIDIWPVECDIDNDCKDDIFSLESVKVEEEKFENGNFKFEVNGSHKIDTAGKQKDLEIDAFEDRHEDSEDDLPLISLGAKSKTDDVDIEQPCIQTNMFSKPCEIKSNSTDCNINDVHKRNLDLESPVIKTKPKMKRNTKPVIKKEKHPAKIMKKKIFKQSVNILTKNTSEASAKYIFECDDCGKKFLTKDILADHISYSHKTQKNSDAVRTQVEQTPVPQLMDIIYKCGICEFKTSQTRFILTHLKAHVAKQMYCCNNCDYKCTRKGRFQSHIKIHTGEKPFSCNICEYKCITKGNLQAHMKIHTGEKPFSCNTCEYRCISKDSLQKHMKRHTSEKPFSCNICKYTCISKHTLQKHMKMHTSEKPFSCDICKYRCITKSHLQAHMKIHAGEKPFSCNICEYRCISKSYLESHLESHLDIHTGEKPFSCNICKYRWTTKRNLERHLCTKLH